MLRSMLLLGFGILLLVVTSPGSGRTLSRQESHALFGGDPVNHPGKCCVDIGMCGFQEFFCADHFGNEPACSEDGYRRKRNPDENKLFCEGEDDPGDICLQDTEQHQCFAYHYCLYDWNDGSCDPPPGEPFCMYNYAPNNYNGPC